MLYPYTIAVYFLEDSSAESEQVPRRQLRGMSNVLSMPTNQFVANFRVSNEIFANILDVVRNKVDEGHRSTKIRPDIKVATFLRFLATGSYQQTVGNENVSLTARATAGKIIRECLELFEDFICPRWIKMPDRNEEREIMETFFDSTGVPGVVGCLDGTHIRIKSPPEDIRRLYYNRKGYYSINAMVVCDRRMRVRFVDAQHPGANHGSFIWDQSEDDDRMQTDFDGRKRNAWILGDGGYKLKPFLMTPFRNPGDAAERRFNKKHASARNIVERCFGVLKNRFRCIIGSRGLHYAPEKVTQIINACCGLHNMCIENNAPNVDQVEVGVDISPNDVEVNNAADSRALAIRRGIALSL